MSSWYKKVMLDMEIDHVCILSIGSVASPALLALRLAAVLITQTEVSGVRSQESGVRSHLRLDMASE